MVLLALLSVAPLELGEVLDSVEAQFPALVAARADRTAAEGERQAAEGAFDPSWKTRATGVPVGGYPQVRVESVIEGATPLWGAQWFAGYRLGIGAFPDYYGERRTWSGGEFRAGVQVPLLRNGATDRRRVTLGRASLGQQASALFEAQQRLELRRVATVRYWEWRAAGARRAVAKALLDQTREREVQLARRATAGEVAAFEREENRRALIQREAAVVQAQRQVEQAALELSLFLRTPDGQPSVPDEARLRPELSSAQAEFPEGTAPEARPDVVRLELQKTQLEWEASFHRNQLLPGLDVGVAVAQDVGNSPGPAWNSLGKTELELTATLDVPVLWRAGLGRVKSAEAAVGKADAQLTLARDRARMEVEDARSGFKAAQRRVALAEDEVAAAERLERGERTRFELGESTLLLVNLREQATAEARLRQIDAWLDSHRAGAAMKAALGQLPR